jgi:hypothetical protein
MPTYYTVDRLGSLMPGQVIDLKRYDDVRPVELQRHVDDLFPLGVSAHGERYFLKNRTDNVADPRTELHFEYVRRALFPERPSRFTSVFAATSIEGAKDFRSRFGKPNDSIWQLEADHGFAANMNLLAGDENTILVRSYCANAYWQGEAGPSPSPFWEMLLPSPVRVVRQVI